MNIQYAPDLHGTGLVVSAVGAGHQLSVGVVSREPALKVVLADGSVVERAGDDVDDVVGEAQRLVELLGGGDHLLLHLVRGL